jgi:hypothetical protein
MTTTPSEPVRDEDIETVGAPAGPAQMGLGDADGTDATDTLAGDGDATDGGDADGTDGGDADGTDA